ncbi:MAG: N-formylglutamate amidohydrolase [Alphaproteobacteria bacterium]|nr:N-formylglutamate amidohydrolase [Alphaproteobacteria bacterium]
MTLPNQIWIAPDADTAPRPCDVLEPASRTLPFVFASPHSGANYPEEFLAASPLDSLRLRSTEDCYVDELFAAAPALGAPLLRALFPRAWLDANRGPYELDPAMFRDPLPPYVEVQSRAVARGLGTIARIVADGAEIYRQKLSFAEARRRVQAFYRPYHAALERLIGETQARFGCCVLIDCHSMPSSDIGGESKPVDFVLGDCFGTSCDSSVTECAETFLQGFGYAVRRNRPYAGGFTTRHYGHPKRGVHALQIEINRALYVDEQSLQRRSGFALLQARLEGLIARLGDLPRARLAL